MCLTYLVDYCSLISRVLALHHHTVATCFPMQLLDACTEKLGLVSAARKLFLSDGTPVAHASQLPRDVDVYVSCGEAFRDPYTTVRGILPLIEKHFQVQ